MKLTEYEMAVLRKQMKKNAVWTPSLTMVNRELERKHRTRSDFEREKARCEAAGEELLNEEPETLLQIATAQGVDDPALTATANAADGLTAPGESAPARDESVEAAEGKRSDRDTQRQQAMRAVRALEDATKTIQNAADGLKELTFSAHAVSTPPTSAQRKKSTARPATNKRKRDTTPPPPAENTMEREKESETVQADIIIQQPEPKRPRLQLIAPAPPVDRALPTTTFTPAEASLPKEPTTPVVASPVPASPVAASSAAPSLIVPSPAPRSPPVARSPVAQTPVPESPPAQTPVAQTPVPLREKSSNTVQVPLAPAGPSTPKASKPETNEATRQATPVRPSPAEPKRSSLTVAVSAPEQAQAPAQFATTAASTRSRRESVALKNSSPPPPEPSKSTLSNVPVVEPAASPEPAIALRPRSSRSHVPTPKAQSEEPKPNESSRPTRDSRRHSIFSQSALTAPAPTRVSSRKKPPPKGEVTSAENGQKTVTNVKRSQGSKNGKKKKTEDQPGHVEDVDSDEERYCICDDVSYGSMISCDNNVGPFAIPGFKCANMCSATKSGFISSASA